MSPPRITPPPPRDALTVASDIHDIREKLEENAKQNTAILVRLGKMDLKLNILWGIAAAGVIGALSFIGSAIMSATFAHKP